MKSIKHLSADFCLKSSKGLFERQPKHKHNKATILGAGRIRYKIISHNINYSVWKRDTTYQSPIVAEAFCLAYFVF